MKRTTKRSTRLLGLLLTSAVLVSACASSQTGGDDGTGGASTTGGSGTGGQSATGGVTGTGGVRNTGGNTGSGGTGPGGALGTGGTGTGGNGTGGSGTGGSGTAGSKGTGGSGPGGGGTGGMAGAKGTGGMAGTKGTGGGGGTAGAKGTGGAAGGGSGSYDPCPTNGDPCKVLPFGDSITYGLITVAADKASSDSSVNGKDSHGGYRVQLFSDAVAAGKNMTFVGSQTNGPTTVANMPFPKSHEGWSGYTIAQMMPYVSTDMKYNPHIILVHLGTNDTYMSDPGGAPMRLQTLVDAILAAYPDALVVLAKIIPYPSQASNVNAINASVPTLVQSRAAMGKHIVLCDQFTGFMPATMQAGDGVHPNQTGYNFMGDTWYSVIGSYLH